MEHTGRTNICSIVFLDIVGFSKAPDAQQMAMKEHLIQHITDAVADIPEDERIVLDTGDGAAICFLGDPEDALFVTTAIMAAVRGETGDARQLLRVGINLGPVKKITDFNGRPNVIGDGINVAQRIMSFAGDDEILVSRSFFEVVARLREGNEKLFQYLGAKKDKHIREHQVYAISPELEKTYRQPARTPTVATLPAVVASSAPPVKELMDEKSLAEVTSRLTQRLGPLAKVIVRRAAETATSMEDFYAGLAATIHDAADRADFLADVPMGDARSGDVQTRQPPAEISTISEALQLSAARHLADHLGPLAPVIVRKAAAEADDRHAFLALLAGYITDKAARARFLSAMGHDAV